MYVDGVPTPNLCTGVIYAKNFVGINGYFCAIYFLK